MEYILRYNLSPDDVEFLNETSIDWDLHKPNTLGPNDSGWCDASTGGYIINEQDRAIFKNVSQSELTFLTLKYGSRLKQLTSTMQGIYNEAYVNNVSPNSVIDSETII